MYLFGIDIPFNEVLAIIIIAFFSIFIILLMYLIKVERTSKYLKRSEEIHSKDVEDLKELVFKDVKYKNMRKNNPIKIYPIEKIPNINLKTVEKLEEFKITNTKDVLEADISFVSTKGNIDFNEMKKIYEISDLMQIPGIDADNAYSLREMGINNVEELSIRAPTLLSEQIKDFNLKNPNKLINISSKQIEVIISNAKNLILKVPVETKKEVENDEIMIKTKMEEKMLNAQAQKTKSLNFKQATTLVLNKIKTLILNAKNLILKISSGAKKEVKTSEIMIKNNMEEKMRNNEASKTKSVSVKEEKKLNLNSSVLKKIRNLKNKTKPKSKKKTK
ncbi:MAG: DUF4332 domain-containing protein [Candidatus Nanoarchaeia archaeon]|jgi:hypothetical protein